MALITAHRPAVEWLTDLQKAKAEGISGNKPKITIQDLIERINDPNAPETALIPSSPRSVEACFRLGIDPIELQFHPIQWYTRPGEDEDIARIRYEKNEHVRQERLRSLIDTRKMLIDENWAPGDAGRPGTSRGLNRSDSQNETSAMVEKERKRLEVLKRRQERDLQQMVAYEISRKELLDKQQKKVDELDKRAQQLVRMKQENDAAWAARQREFELQKMREEKELEREAKRMAEERYRREKEMQMREREEERRRKKEAYVKEMERRAKADEARKETEAILAMQAEEVRQRKLEMEKRDQERVKRLEKEAKERAAANLVKRKKADQRIQSALTMNQEILRRKRSVFEEKEASNEARRRELSEQRRREEERKAEEERRKERERQEKYLAALETEEMRKMSIKQRAEEKERMLAELYARRKKENDIKKVETEFELKLRLDKVDMIQKTNLYQRQQLLEKIMNDYDKTRSLMKERQSLQEQRKMANMHASLQRHAMTQVMDQLRFGRVDKLASSNGQVNINELLQRSRPATAM
mmetsp:Transcript_36136/g.80419  ORF Transcript_36136/g.80419 Transcript_36136/m.80419 type:complete len:530 (-) Transcript_36136:827-2416(-)|eukprot:CAMPEP_0202897616 /NCGR_PEP_ID=MMETSP1392-20130828/6332_1 /ASSEMBLY_ACC=CAM_ASM_000868 /TAXON_ID=225041 /ORGANISM="Chlamydomonas chlamydogama, Strain SAG 11-48b" /LENGTH=529 /DNA_ID=CAMNT_0049583301 /DNA_START=178 /DNA_END=1767 /DNA_ORIENTATION=-